MRKHYCVAHVHQWGEHEVRNFVAPEGGSVHVCLTTVGGLQASNALGRYLENSFHKILSSTMLHFDWRHRNLPKSSTFLLLYPGSSLSIIICVLLSSGLLIILSVRLMLFERGQYEDKDSYCYMVTEAGWICESIADSQWPEQTYTTHVSLCIRHSYTAFLKGFCTLLHNLVAGLLILVYEILGNSTNIFLSLPALYQTQ